MIVYPFGIATFVLLRRYSMYEGRRLDAIAWNDAREAYLTEVFDQLSRPLDALISTHRFSCDPDENDVGGLLSGSLKLAAQDVPAPDTPPVSARWFAHPHSDENGDKYTRDSDRQRGVLRWAFCELLNDVEEVVRGLPNEINLAIHLVYSGTALQSEVAAQYWGELWASRQLRSAKTTAYADRDAMWLDTWLDRINERQDQEARLLIFVELHSLLEQAPQVGSSEAAIALLLVPPSVTERFRLTPVAQAHRPAQVDATSPIGAALTNALRWGRSTPDDVNRIWQTGLDASSAGVATQAWVMAGINETPTNMDYMIGHAEGIAPWLAIACAAQAAAIEQSPQLIIASSSHGLRIGVVRAS
ncbi:hypothetical protein LJR230_001381 [Trinickia sp. LjRoot230]|uniref:hypothetical protein n=1 Tax=Trinickia sp. LjRoot230 TaxID=3342288 RepID=UPI003ECE50D9